MSDRDLIVPLLDVREQRIVELLMDLVDVLDLEEDVINLLHGQHGLGGGGRGLQRTHGLKTEKKNSPWLLTHGSTDHIT